jgi:CheY-like chemotaxis protein
VPRPAHPSRTVLLVEDNEDSASVLATILELHGYVVRVAKSVHEALELVEHADILISDIGLPDGTGYELMRTISSRRRIPGIALSGYGSNEDMRRSAEAGFELHIVKPVEPNRLLDALERLATQ